MPFQHAMERSSGSVLATPLRWACWVCPALACIALAIGSSAAAAQDSVKAMTAVQAVPALDVDRYMGTWFEIAKFPNYFQRKCASDTQAIYSKRADGLIKVLNSCKTNEGKVNIAQGLARPDLTTSPLSSKLQVRFAPAWLSWLPFVWGRYWVVMLDPDYRYAVVSEPRRKYLWILSRTAHMDKMQYDGIVEQIRALGFDTQKLQRSVQTATNVTP